MVGAAGLEPATLSLEGIGVPEINSLAGLGTIAHSRYTLFACIELRGSLNSVLVTLRNAAMRRVGTKLGTVFWLAINLRYS
jgi:hypothetical protein